MNTAEPIEILTASLALLALLTSIALFWHAAWIWIAAIQDRRCEAIRMLAWARLRNEAFRAVVSAGVTYSGILQVMSPAPPVPGPNRTPLQIIWLLIAAICLAQSIWNERDARRISEIIERERSERRTG